MSNPRVVILPLRMSVRLHTRLAEAAQNKDVDKADICRIALSEYLERQTMAA